jgi:PHS family inorganic phosphate transporter-like MFS transporter
VVFVSGLGFFSAAYQIFATNLTLPILAQLYNYDDTQQMCLRITLFIGVIVGQLFFGLLADLYGRQKYFGYELKVLVIAGIGICMAAESPAMRW